MPTACSFLQRCAACSPPSPAPPHHNAYCLPQSVLSWQRARAACFLAANGRQWTDAIAEPGLNSGTGAPAGCCWWRNTALRWLQSTAM